MRKYLLMEEKVLTIFLNFPLGPGIQAMRQYYTFNVVQ